MYTNGNINVTTINKLIHFNDNNFFTKKLNHTNNTTNNITRHNHINSEHSVIKTINKHMKHTSKYGTEINYYNKKSLNKDNHYNFYHGTFNFRMN